MGTKDKVSRIHSYVVNPEENVGEQVSITTKFVKNNYGEVFYEQEISLQSYGNAVSLYLGSGVLTPKKLRELADQLEQMSIETRDVT